MIKALNQLEDEGKKLLEQVYEEMHDGQVILELVMIIVINYLLWRVIMIQLVLLENINEH